MELTRSCRNTYQNIHGYNCSECPSGIPGTLRGKSRLSIAAMRCWRQSITTSSETSTQISLLGPNTLPIYYPSSSTIRSLVLLERRIPSEQKTAIRGQFTTFDLHRQNTFPAPANSFGGSALRRSVATALSKVAP